MIELFVPLSLAGLREIVELAERIEKTEPLALVLVQEDDGHG